MNIFRLHDDPKICATMHCDKHVPKMILETAQMLSTAHRITEEDNAYADEHRLYKSAYKNHPATIWVRHSEQNYFWSVQLFKYLCEEYTKRYGKNHASSRLLPPFQKCPKEASTEKIPIPVPQCMPDLYKVENNPVQAYRNYYGIEKVSFARWNKGTAAPNWWDRFRRS